MSHVYTTYKPHISYGHLPPPTPPSTDLSASCSPWHRPQELTGTPSGCGMETTVEFFSHNYLRTEEVTCPKELMSKHFIWPESTPQTLTERKTSIMLYVKSQENGDESLLVTFKCNYLSKCVSPTAIHDHEGTCNCQMKFNQTPYGLFDY